MPRAGALAALLVLLILPGCATDKSRTPGDPSQQSVNVIPWNRPEKWEGQGMVPGFSGSQ